MDPARRNLLLSHDQRLELEDLRPRIKRVSSRNGSKLEQNVAQHQEVERRQRFRVGAVVSVVFGAVGLVAWILPAIGFAIGSCGLFIGVRSHNRAGKNLSRVALAGISLSALAMTLAVTNWVVCAYMNTSGKNVLSGIFK